MDFIILPAAQAAFGLAAVILLALYVFRINKTGLNRAILAIAAVIAALSSAFVYFYSSDNEVFLSGLTARRAGLLVFCSSSFMVLFSLRREKYGEYFFIGTSAAMFVFSLSLYGAGIPLMAAAFFAMDIFGIFFKKKETENGLFLHADALVNKLVYFIPAVAFMFLFLSGPQDLRVQKIGFNGMVIMLILSNIGTFFTATNHELPNFKQLFMPTGPLLSFIPAIAQFFILSSLMRQYEAVLFGSFISIIVLLLLLGAAFKSVTEEKYGLFAVRDIYILFFLGIFGCAAARLSPAHTAVYSMLFMLKAAFSMESFSAAGSAKQTMTGVKYSFDTIPDNGKVFISVLTGLCAEIFMIVSVYKNIINDPLIHAAALIGAALYAPAFLNKVFTLFSMIKRIGAGFKPRQLFNTGALIMVLFTCMAAAMLYKW